jgi:hypothetical protein
MIDIMSLNYKCEEREENSYTFVKKMVIIRNRNWHADDADLAD